jgi:nitrate reductase delta subunit
VVSVAAVDTRAETLTLLARLLDYPTPRLPDDVTTLVGLVAEDAPRAAALLLLFLDELERTPSGRLEELYSSAFDFDLPTEAGLSCYPHVGHYLLGESYRRSRLLVGLLERYREHGFEVPEGELPDHLAVILRFLAHAPDSDAAAEIVSEALLPALARMTHERPPRAAEPDGRRLYLGVLEAIRLVLREALWPHAVVASYALAVEQGPAGEDVSPRVGCGGR